MSNINNYKTIRATFNKDTIIVYQAFNDKIADEAVKLQKFGNEFSFRRMTWIKPSFLWMMERSNWANKVNQNRILEIHLKRDFWNKCLELAVDTDASKSNKNIKDAQILVQWDPERTLRGAKLNIRSIQIGVSRNMINEYNENIERIVDLTEKAKKMYLLNTNGKFDKSTQLLPKTKEYKIV
ncbi:hypothetical protein Fleli_1378 [Bernardetia litoralis DSM 6794]|uniref:DUF4291 domain-containing protein n=1 Tax=Bernardetia litoralis (strain ATCC 23117 / DSM 6794 / NBRC 15988 / NCIMB 1366 / Fx l1 / Sio-4) TaxID=880071 RepID=I4AIM4_BERLS|nr:DUF4291 domain-containing protein [Bernardetia litoralis]AFM03809.1 hypothetical protein Fleli_1378 [Bernardetia litoralis DSM 6794]